MIFLPAARASGGFAVVTAAPVTEQVVEGVRCVAERVVAQ